MDVVYLLYTTIPCRQLLGVFRSEQAAHQWLVKEMSMTNAERNSCEIEPWSVHDGGHSDVAL